MSRLFGWTALLATGVLALARAGHGPLATPPLDHEFVRWATESPPSLVLFSVLRVVALGVGCYLLGAALLSVVAGMTRWHPIVRLADVLTPRFLRIVVGVTFTSTALAPAIAVAAPGPGSAPSAGAGDPPPTMVIIDPAATPKAQPTTWTVQRGQSFWSIAEELAGRPSDVAPYWVRLVAGNRARLRFPDRPGLIYPGQRFDLPRR